ncbi:hypothetical protein [Streptomyces sp. NPDC057540]
MRAEEPVKPGLRMECADGRRLVLLQGADAVAAGHVPGRVPDAGR